MGSWSFYPVSEERASTRHSVQQDEITGLLAPVTVTAHPQDGTHKAQHVEFIDSFHGICGRAASPHTRPEAAKISHSMMAAA
jgi:hypothetical protein